MVEHKLIKSKSWSFNLEMYYYIIFRNEIERIFLTFQTVTAPREYLRMFLFSNDL